MGADNVAPNTLAQRVTRPAGVANTSWRPRNCEYVGLITFTQDGGCVTYGASASLPSMCDHRPPETDRVRGGRRDRRGAQQNVPDASELWGHRRRRMKGFVALLVVMALCVSAGGTISGEPQASRETTIEQEMRRLAAYEVDLVLRSDIQGMDRFTRTT